MSYCVVQYEKGVIGVGRESDFCAEAAPCVSADWCGGEVHAVIDPFLEVFLMSAYAEVVGSVVDFDFNSVDGYVLVHVGFKADCIAIRVKLGDGFACALVVLLSYV